MNTKKLIEIHNKKIAGKWHPTHRKGNTGIGKTYEDLVGIKENNSKDSDLSDAEIKCKRIKSKASTTLFTKNPNSYGMDLAEAIKKYGDWDPTKKRWGLYSLKNFTKEITDDKILLKNGDKVIFSWNKKTLEGIEKIDNLVYVTADTKKINGVEYFWYHEPIVIKDAFRGKIKDFIESGVIYFEPRVWYSPDIKRAPRDRGWAWRIRPSKLSEIIKNRGG